MEYHVRLMPRAQEDIEELYAWVIRRAPHQGSVWYNGLISAMKSLATQPERCPAAPEGIDLGESVRQLLYGKRPYRILFWIKGSEVQILHVRRGARKYWTPQAVE